jgi:hypothetical protein
MKPSLFCIMSLVSAACSSAAAPSMTDTDPAALASDALEVGSSSCHVGSGETLVHVTLKVDQYRGLQHGHNGDHEIVESTITATTSAGDPSLVDTDNVEVAMNVHSSIDPTGLPHEVPLAAGASFEVEGQYIPAARANAHNAKGAAAVIHFTHSPCGFVTIAGQEYR